MLWAGGFAAVALFSSSSAERIPREVTWTDATFGPDGPWRAASVQMGGNGDPVALYPGSTWETWLIEDDYCSRSDTCYASKAGTYDASSSSGTQGGIGLLGELDPFMLGLDLSGERGRRYMDYVSLNGVKMANASLMLLESQVVKYPGGRTVPFFAGCLSLGGGGAVNQSFALDAGPAINASVPPGWMWEQAWTPSNSFGMHIGSVQPDMPGSLWFGGYDRNRVVGDVLGASGSPRSGITLWDVGIDVVGDDSPFDYKSKDGLLARGNSSIGGGIKVAIDGCSPYLTLPKSTCDAIAADLPVDFDAGLGLYLWDTSSDRYADIIASSASLVFSFISGSNTDAVKIRYVLGRAFLQDAFVGANWHPEADTWWLAQAPGRSIQATANAVAIQETDKEILSGGNDWEASWTGVWDEEKKKKTVVPSETPTPSSDDHDDGSSSTEEETDGGGLSVGALAGIGVGAAVLALILGLGTLFFWRRRGRRGQNQEMPPSRASTPDVARSASSSKLPTGELHSQWEPPPETRQELHNQCTTAPPGPGQDPLQYERYELAS
ncbi:hypothetical protein N3K66_005304 [Trichothecium roseum]|uniref:Uncharacterized protein n=1 Tax=Trichothecium roseum TaxID=47278 RepID=A0ACC0UXJ8_9HYPO|nr:hypothetical protein N3K66_005304 [Trichothecium roseum]